MTVYWVDPSKESETQGNGTYASPWTGRGSQAISDGDEVRIKSYDLDEMTEFTFTGTTYCWEWSITSMSIPGTNLNPGDVVVNDLTKTAFIVHYVYDTSIKVYGQRSSVTWFNPTQQVQTFRKIKEQYLSQKFVDSYTQLMPSSKRSNVTYSDGWVSETSRKTDLTALTILTGKQDIDRRVYIGNVSNSTFDLRCTCMLPCNSMQYIAGVWNPSAHSRQYVDWQPTDSTTIYIHQIVGGDSYGMNLFNSSTDLVNCDMTVNYLSSYYGAMGNSTILTAPDNCDITINHLMCQAFYMYSRYFKNTNITIKEFFIAGPNTPLFYANNAINATGTFTVTLDGNMYAAGTKVSGFTSVLSTDLTLNLTSNFNYYYNNVLQTNIDYFVNSTISHFQENISFRVLPILNNSSPSMVSPTQNRARICHTHYTPDYTPKRDQAMPTKVNDYIVLYDSVLNMVFEDYRTADSSYLIINRATQETYEELSCPMRYGHPQYSFIVNKDNVNYKTNAPGYSFYLQTFSTSYNNAFYNKVIKIPLQSGARVIKGWIKTDVGLFNQGDLEAVVVAESGNIMFSDEIDIAAAEAGWTQFSVSVIPFFPQVVDLKIRFKPKAGNKTFWLSDIEVSGVVDLFGDGSGLALYNLDGNGIDQSGNYHLTGSTTYTGGKFGQARYTNTIMNNATAGTQMHGNASVSLWIKPVTGANGNWNNIFNITSSSSNGAWRFSEWYHGGQNGSLHPHYNGTGVSVSTGKMNLDAWNHVARVQKDNHHYVYINGVMTDSFAATNITSGLVNFQLGHSSWPSGSSVGIDQVRLFTKALTASEVTALMYETIVTEGLVLNLDAGNTLSYPGSGTIWYDISGNGNNGTLMSGVGFDSGDKSLTFSGSNQYVDCPMTKGVDCTINVWATCADIVNKMLFNAGPGNVGPDLYFSVGLISLNIWDGSTNSFASIPASANDGNYHYYTVVNDSVGGAKLYYDGVLLGSATYRDVSTTTNLAIGGSDTSYFWNGKISMFSVYNKALSQEEVTQNFNVNKLRFGL